MSCMQGSCIFLSSPRLDVHPMVAPQVEEEVKSEPVLGYWVAKSILFWMSTFGSSLAHTFKPHFFFSFFISHRNFNFFLEVFTLIWETNHKCFIIKDSHIWGIRETLKSCKWERNLGVGKHPRHRYFSQGKALNANHVSHGIAAKIQPRALFCCCCCQHVKMYKVGS